MPISNEIYDTANRPHPIVEEVQAIFKYKELVTQTISRSIKTRYKRSLLGVLWTMLNPILTMIVLTIVFSSIFKFSVESYPVYILSGLVVWSFFSSSTGGAMGEMLWGGTLLARIYVPKSIFAISSVGTGLVNLLISLIPLFGIAIALRVSIHPSVLVLPISIFILSVFTLGVGLLLSTVVVYFADMQPIYEVVLMIWFYGTPIIYPIEVLPENFDWIVYINPMYYMVEIFRIPILDGALPDINTWLIAVGFAVTSLALGGWVFASHSNEYAYRI